MASIFRIRLLPALHGDCIWIEYGEAGATHHVLVDGGPLGAFGALRAHVEALPAAARDVELLVVTHIDADHIDGIVKLLRHPELGLTFREVWFNGWPQLERSLAGGAFVPQVGNDRGRVQRKRARSHRGATGAPVQRAVSAGFPRWLRRKACCRACDSPEASTSRFCRRHRQARRPAHGVDASLRRSSVQARRCRVRRR